MSSNRKRWRTTADTVKAAEEAIAEARIRAYGTDAAPPKRLQNRSSPYRRQGGYRKVSFKKDRQNNPVKSFPAGRPGYAAAGKTDAELAALRNELRR